LFYVQFNNIQVRPAASSVNLIYYLHYNLLNYTPKLLFWHLIILLQSNTICAALSIFLHATLHYYYYFLLLSYFKHRQNYVSDPFKLYYVFALLVFSLTFSNNKCNWNNLIIRNSIKYKRQYVPYTNPLKHLSNLINNINFLIFSTTI
jgi:hypothetical protein